MAMVAVVAGATEPRAMEQRAHLPALLRPKGNVAEAAVAVANRVWRGGPSRRRGGAAETIGLLCWKSSQFSVVPPFPLWLLCGSCLTLTPQASCSLVQGSEAAAFFFTQPHATPAAQETCCCVEAGV